MVSSAPDAVDQLVYTNVFSQKKNDVTTDDKITDKLQGLDSVKIVKFTTVWKLK